MMVYWNNLNDRERWMLGFGSVCLVVFLFYLLVYSPLIGGMSEKSQQLIEKQDTLAFLQMAKQQQIGAVQAQVLSPSQLLTVLAEQLNKSIFHRNPYQLQQTSSGDIQLSFDEVPFNGFLSWLWSINQKYVFSIQQLNAERTATPGVVKLLLMIRS